MVSLSSVSVSPQSTVARKYRMENFRNKQFISCKLHSILSSLKKSLDVPLCPTLAMDHPFVQHLHAALMPRPLSLPSHIGDHINLSRYHGACVQETLSLLENGLEVQE